MTRLTDHRRFARDTAVSVAVAGALLAVLLLLTHRERSAAGVGVGALVGLFDILLMVRSLDRLRRLADGVPSAAVSVSVFTRFLLVGLLIGVMMCFRQLDPIGVVAGFLLFPASIGLVGGLALRRAHRKDAHGRLGGAAG